MDAGTRDWAGGLKVKSFLATRRVGICLAIGAAILLLPSAVAQKKTLVVAADGSGQFKTVQEAVDSAPGGNVRIDIKPGEYRNLINVSANGVDLRGLGKAPAGRCAGL